MGGYLTQLPRRLGNSGTSISSSLSLPKNLACHCQFGMVAVGYEKYGSQEELEKDPLMHLYNIYVKINKESDDDPKVKADAASWFKRMEDGDEEALKQWHGWQELSVKKYREAYDQLNIKFDLYTGESNVGKESMDKVLVHLEDMGLISQRQGALEIDLGRWGLKTPIVRKTGA